MNAARTLMLSALATACLVAFPQLGALGNANAGVQKCVSADGSVSYTDGACGSMGQPQALPAHLARSIASDAVSTIEYDANGSVSAPSRLSPRSAQAGCARTPDQLQADLGYAFASRDVNRIAGNYHWVGLNQGDARGIIGKLESMADDRVVRSELFEAGLGSSFASSNSSTDASNTAGYLQLALANGTPIQMKVTQYRGCYFASF